MSEIEKFFDYKQDKKYFLEFAVTLKHMLLICEKCKYFNDIINLLDINDKKIINELNQIDINTKIDNKYVRSPHEIQDKSYLWLYYAFFNKIFLEKKEISHKDKLKIIINLIFQIHLRYLIIFKNNSKNYTLNKLNAIILALVRMIEILMSFLGYNDEDVIKLYFFDSNLLMNFFITINDQLEISKYKIITDKNNKNKIKYDSKIIIDTSRKLHKSETILSTILNLYNDIEYFFCGNLDISRKIKEYSKNIINKNFIIPEGDVQQVLLYPVQINLSNNFSEQIEQQSKISYIDRLDEKNIPNRYRQKLKNKAISANITKNNLLSLKSYNVPPKELLKDFIEHLFGIAKNNEEKYFNIIFIFGIISGQNFKDIIDILLQNNNLTKIKLNKNKITVKIDDSFLAKKINKSYFEDTGKEIYYKVPYLFSLVLLEVKKYVSSIKNIKDIEQQYKNYIKNAISNFDKTINIEIDKSYKMLLTYLKDIANEDISLLFCVATYSQNDTSKLAYATIPQKVEYYSYYIKRLYNDLNIEQNIIKFLGLKKYKINDNIILDTKIKYAGSNLVVKEEILRNFFEKLYQLIKFENDKYKRFNYISIYVRYALSLFAGTRTFEKSANLKDISFEFKIMKISEKAQTKLSGLRIVPLCDIAIKLIKYYKKECKKLKVESDNFYIYTNNNFEIIIENNIKKLVNIEDNIKNFLLNVPLNFGRHIFTKYAIENGIPNDFINGFLGHYSLGMEQFGLYSTLNFKEYIKNITQLTTKFAILYNIRVLDE